MSLISGKVIDISIVVVNFRVKEYVVNLLESIEKARGKLNLQIIVIDNNSNDDSISYLKEKFPLVTYIQNEKNLGFGRANNQCFNLAKGEFTLIINPDTIVSEDTLQIMVNHMYRHPNCGASGCKILNPDGTFAPESKRSVPTISTAISKVFGLNALFPKSKVFGRYHLGWIDENEVSEIEVLSGCFMFWRTHLLQQLGGFDERFFMYGEDIDLCFRIKKTQFHIDYVPTTSIIHYKGESTRKGDLKYVRIFNKALYQFFEKHYSSKYSLIFRVFIFFAITLRIGISFIYNNLRLIGFILSDLLLLNISVIIGFLFRFSFEYDAVINLKNLQYLWINVLASSLYVLLGASIDLFKTKANSISSQLKAILASYGGVTLITFFARDLAFSRLALIYGLLIALVLMIITRFMQINFSKNNSKITGKLKRTKILLVGNEESAKPIKQQIYARPDWNYDVIGTVSVKDSKGDYLGSLPQLIDLIRAYNVDQIFFLLNSISYTTMIEYITKLENVRVILKLIPDSMDFILGKSNVEYLEQIPIVDIDVPYTKTINRWMKRMLDILISMPIIVTGLPLLMTAFVKMKKHETKVGAIKLLAPIIKYRHLNRLLLVWNVFIGKLHIVGSELSYNSKPSYSVKPGIVGYVQINKRRLQHLSDADNYLLYYFQNYTIWLDIDIMMKSPFSNYSVLQNLEEERKKQLNP